MGRDIRGNNKITESVQISGDGRPATKKKKISLKDFMNYKIATQVRADAAFLRNKKK